MDASRLPPGFSHEVFEPVRNGRAFIDQWEIRHQVLELAKLVAEIVEHADHRLWFFWEKIAGLLSHFVNAAGCTIFRQGTQSILHKIHPLQAEEETEDVRWPPNREEALIWLEEPPFAQTAMLRIGKRFPVVLKFQSPSPLPRINVRHLEALSDTAEIFFSLLARKLPENLATASMAVFSPREEQPAGATLILGQDPNFLAALASVRQAASSDSTVYLHGESGTGKEVFARHLHELSGRRDGPFIPINCSAVPHELIESELFGHEKGAFTGAYYRKIGKAEQANGGTLFLDEIGEMPLPFQAKLLRFLQEKRFTRVGGNAAISSDARIVVATHRDLKEMVTRNAFREDLYYRSHVIPIRIAPLRERGRDIGHLSETFFAKYIKSSRASRRQVEDTVFDVLERYHFPGNVRELENIIQRTVVMTQKAVITAEDLPDDIFKKAEDVPEIYRLHPFEKFDHFLPPDRETLKALKKEVEFVAFSYQRDLDRRFLLHLLDQNAGSARKAAEAAAINRTLFYKLLKRAGLDIGLIGKVET